MADVASLTLRIASSQAEAAAKRTDATLKRLDNTATMVGQSFKRLGVTMTAAITAPFALASAAAIKTSAQFEKARISFGVFVGDMRKGAQVFDNIVQLAAKTPLNVSSLQSAAQILLATGAATAKSLIPMLKNLGNISRADSGILQRLALNLSQVATQGKLTGRELRDFAVAGVPLLQALATQMGKTTSQIKDLVSKGAIGFSDVTRAFQSMTAEGGKFNNLMEKLSQTVAGKWTTAVDNVRISLAGFADLFRTEIKFILDGVINLAQKINTLSPAIKRIIVIAGGIAAALGPALLIIGGIITSIAAVKASFAFLGIVIAPVLILLVKIGLVIAGIVLAVEGLRRAFGITWAEIGQGLMNFAQTAIGFFANFRTNWGMLTKWLGDNWKNLLSDLIANIIIFSKNLIDNIVVAFNAIGGFIGVFAGFFLDEWQNMLSSLVNKLVSWATSVIDFFLEIGGKIVESIKKGIAGEDFVLPDFLDRLVEGAARTGTLSERLSAELKKVNFVPLTKGFQKSFGALPKFVTDFSLFTEKAGRDLETAFSTPGLDRSQFTDAQGGGGASTKLAGALEAGSAEAFKLLASQRDPEGKKVAGKNLSANQTSAFELSRIRTDGVKLTGVKTVGAF